MHRSTHPLGAKQAERSAAVSHTQWSRQCKTGPSSIQIPWQPSGNYVLLNNAPPHFPLLNSLCLHVRMCVLLSVVEQALKTYTQLKVVPPHPKNTPFEVWEIFLLLVFVYNQSNVSTLC